MPSSPSRPSRARLGALAVSALALAGSLAAPLVAQDAPARMKVLIVSGANNHDWKFTSPELETILEETGRFEADITYEPGKDLADLERLRGYDAILLDYNGPRWGDAADAAFLAAVRDHGVGVSVIHAANNPFPGFTEFETLVGHLWRDGTGHGAFHEFTVEIVDHDHPITRGMTTFDAHPDELYHRLVNVQGVERRLLAHAFSSPESRGTGENEPMVLVGTYGEARVFHTPLGHVWVGAEGTKRSVLDPRFRDLVARGTEWAATGEVRDSFRAPNVLTEAERAAGWRPLFDGTTLDGWRGYRSREVPEGWRVEDGWIVSREGGSGGDLITTSMFGDFDLEFEWRAGPNANSGVMFHVRERAEQSYHSGPEYQILDDVGLGVAADADHSVGALYGLAAPVQKVRRLAGAVNTSRIRVRGGLVEHWLNGYPVATLDLDSDDGKRRVAGSKFAAWSDFARFATGHVALQDHGHEVAFRNLRVRDLDEEERRTRMGERVVLFDGTDLSAFQFFLGSNDPEASRTWTVQDGVAVCTGRPAGYLSTLREYRDYVLDVRWRFNPVTLEEGNSGVLLRLVGEDKVWPKSIECQLMSRNAGDIWNIDEFPLEVEPQRTQGRRTRNTHFMERAVGEWNDYQIVVDGGEVIVRVNGQEVNRASGAEVVPGRIGFQSEGAEIHFGRIELVPLRPRTRAG